jgi:tRNA A-37 threonylcarbamoyl transferase component Bud32
VFPRYRNLNPGASPGTRTERIGSLIWTLRTDQPPTWWRAVLADPEAWLRDPSRHFKNSRNVTLARVPSPAPGQPGLVLRRLNYGRWRHRFCDTFRPTRAHRAFHSARALEAAGLPVARPLAVADLRRGRWPVHAYLLSQEIENARTLAQWAHPTRPWSHSLVATLADLLARLHEAGFIHGDLKATNVLITTAELPWLIDFDGVRQFTRVPRARAAKDLARLMTGSVEAGGKASAFTAARFLKLYCASRHRDDWREWCREADRHCRVRRR